MTINIVIRLSLTYLIIKQRFLGKKDLDNVIDDFKNEGYNFNHIEELMVITISNKMDMAYDLFIKHNMHAIEWKLNAMINRNKNLIKKFPSFGDILSIKNLETIVFNK